MSQATQVTLVSRGLPGVESLIRAEADRTIREYALLVDAADVYLRLIAPVVVEAIDGLPIVLRCARAEVCSPGGSRLAKCREVPGQTSECPSCGQAEILQRVSYSMDRA